MNSQILICKTLRRGSRLNACHGLLQVYRATEQTLLPVLPHLAQQLGLEDEARRLAAVDLLGALFSIPGTRLDAEYAQLFTEFLRRFTDQKVSRRDVHSTAAPCCSMT